MKPIIDPFANESDSIQIEGLTIENRTDRLTIYGGIDITRDKKGLITAKQIATILNTVVDKLSGQKNLPESLPKPKTDAVQNPFA